MGRIDCWKSAGNMVLVGLNKDEAIDLLYNFFIDNAKELKLTEVVKAPEVRCYKGLEFKEEGIWTCLPAYDKEVGTLFQTDFINTIHLLRDVTKVLQQSLGHDKVIFEEFEYYDY